MSKPITGTNSAKLDLLVQQSGVTEEALRNLDKRTDKAEAALASLASKIVQQGGVTEEALRNLDKRMDKAETTLLVLTNQVSELSSRVSNLSGTVTLGNRLLILLVTSFVGGMGTTLYLALETKAAVSTLQARMDRRIETPKPSPVPPTLDRADTGTPIARSEPSSGR